jgi:hypothetical protein
MTPELDIVKIYGCQILKPMTIESKRGFELNLD